MPSGVHLTKTYLEQIWHSRIVLEMSTMAIFESVFQSDTNKIGLAYLQTLCNLCDGGDNINRFFGPRLPRSGGPDLKDHKNDWKTHVQVISYQEIDSESESQTVDEEIDEARSGVIQDSTNQWWSIKRSKFHWVCLWGEDVTQIDGGFGVRRTNRGK